MAQSVNIDGTVGFALNVLQLNVEGLAAAKRTVIGNIAHQHKVDVLCLQEIHIADHIVGRYSVYGFDLVLATPDPVYGRAMYVRSDIVDAHVGSSSTFCDVIEVGGFKIVNVYKPPSAHWDKDFPPALEHPVLYVGDFNSHHPKWGHADSNTDGDTLLEWASENKLTLLHDAKLYETFHSARWKKDSSPDLCWVSSSATQSASTAVCFARLST